MAYLKPPWFTRNVFNRIAMATGRGPFETLTVVKRVSKQPQKIPVTPVEVGGVKYLVSAYGETQWVKNVRANPSIKLGAADYLAAETAVGERQPILDAYQAKVGKYVDKQFAELPDEADHPVFALTPET
jgi:F420H(2)-dependent quinone reductase